MNRIIGDFLGIICQSLETGSRMEWLIIIGPTVCTMHTSIAVDMQSLRIFDGAMGEDHLS